MLPAVSLQCDLGYSRWYRREEGHAESPLKCTLPTGVEQSAVYRQESECSHPLGGEVIPSEGHLRAGNTVLYLEAWKVSGATRVNKHNCKDCPKADGKQRLYGIENRCEA